MAAGWWSPEDLADVPLSNPLLPEIVRLAVAALREDAA